MLEAPIHSPWSRRDGSLLPSPQKERKSQISCRRKTEQTEITLWFCCYCGHGGMTQRAPGCAICHVRRCKGCYWEKVQVGWRGQKPALYTWGKDAALRRDAALLGLTAAEPEALQPPDLRNATAAMTYTTPEPGPTYDHATLRGQLPAVPIPDHVTLQSLNEQSMPGQGDTKVSPSLGAPVDPDLSALSSNHSHAIGLSSEPAPLSSCTTITRKAAGRPYPDQHQEDPIDRIFVAFNRWKAGGYNNSNTPTSQTSAGPSSSDEPNQSSAPRQSRKRSSGQDNHSKRGGTKRAKVSSDEPPQAKKEDKRLLACPFWKKDPIRHRDCFRGVKRIRDVKQHLRRSHQQPVFCRRCGEEFGDQEAALGEHLRAAQPCEVRHFQDPDGITTLHQKALKRYSDRSADEASQWYVIWDYLFPGGPHAGAPPPARPSSPYVDRDLSEDMSSFREFSRREGWRALANDPELGNVAFRIDEGLLQRCLDKIYDSWLAEKMTGSKTPREDSPLALSDVSTPAERAPTRETLPIDHQLLDDDPVTLGDYSVDLDFGSDFFGPQIDDLFGGFTELPSVDIINIAQPFPSVPLLTSEHGIEPAVQLATLDPSLISR